MILWSPKYKSVFLGRMREGREEGGRREEGGGRGAEGGGFILDAVRREEEGRGREEEGGG